LTPKLCANHTLCLLTFVSQNCPLNPAGHKHWNRFSRSRHDPPFRHGLDAHSSISLSHLWGKKFEHLVIYISVCSFNLFQLDKNASVNSTCLLGILEGRSSLPPTECRDKFHHFHIQNPGHI